MGCGRDCGDVLDTGMELEYCGGGVGGIKEG